MKLQILVNHFNEGLDIVKRFLDSVELQKNSQFEVLICSDGGKIRIPLNSFEGYSFPIKYCYSDHKGVCGIRNFLLDSSDADYIMFCDIDDCFYKSDGIYSLMSTAEKTNADVVASPYDAEFFKNNKYEYTTLNKDIIRVHGKIFRRDYIVNNNIRYPDEIQTSGDMMFLWLAFALTDNIIWIDNNFYIWKYNDQSLTRCKPFYNIRNYERILLCYTLLLKELQRRELKDLYELLACNVVHMMYLDNTNKYINLIAPKECLDIECKAISKYIGNYYNIYKEVDQLKRYKNYLTILNYKQKEGVSGEFEDILPWLEKQMKR